MEIISKSYLSLLFMNDPKIVAQAAKNVISEYLYGFRNIEFAIYCSPRDDQNYRIFHSIFDVSSETGH